LDFVKQSKDAVLRLQVSTQTLTQQRSDSGSSSGQVPVYGAGASVVGTVELVKIEGVEKVEAKVTMLWFLLLVPVCIRPTFV
jgi:hypothetical protein